MSLTWTVLGTLGEMMLAYFLFMVVAFSGGRLANGAMLGTFQARLLNSRIYALPGSSMASAGIVIGLHIDGAGSDTYWSYALPLAATVAYFAYVIMLARNQR